MIRFCLSVSLICVGVDAVSSGWRPITTLDSVATGPSPIAIPDFIDSYPIEHSALDPEGRGRCTLYKAVFHQEHRYQYIHYKTQIPDMKEFTLCTWHTFYNHSRDQPLFSYALQNRPREILSWVANTDSASYYMLSVSGHTLYRLNYPIRLKKWYHSCQSWNSRTGEWQIWVNSERIGRGFHNLLVGKKIKGGGLAMTGQEQRQYGGSFAEGPKSGGLLGEVMLVQLYKAALTAGKAYNNHKHHHAHHFHHEDKQDPNEVLENSAGGNGAAGQNDGMEVPGLTFMQLIPRLPVEQLTAFHSQREQLDNGGLGLGLLPGLFTALPNNGDAFSVQHTRIFKREDDQKSQSTNRKSKIPEGEEKDMVSREVNENAQIRKGKSVTKEDKEQVALDLEIKKIGVVDDQKHTKRDLNTKKIEISKIRSFSKRDLMEIQQESQHENNKEKEKERITNKDETKVYKREVKELESRAQKKRTVGLFGEPLPIGLPSLDLGGLFVGNEYIMDGRDLRLQGQGGVDTSTKPQTEPAEWEVHSIMSVCSGCAEDPFRKASIISWRETPKKLYAGARYVPASHECQRF